MNADVVDVFLSGAERVAAALSDERLDARWEHASALADQTVGALAAHLARGGVWVVADYLEAAEPPGPVVFHSAAAYFADFVVGLSEDEHRAIRARAAAVAADGPDRVRSQLSERISHLRTSLPEAPRSSLLAVAGGHVMALEDYLVTRVVEQVVHLGDLARSLDREPPSLPEAATSLVIDVGVDVLRRRHGDAAAVRAMFRDGADGLLPVLSEKGPYVLRPPLPGDLGWVVHRHGVLYAQEYGWDDTFEALVCRVVADYVEDHDGRKEAAWIAELDGEPVGCVFCCKKDGATAQLRLLLVERNARGLGLGSRLVEECIRFARRAGYEQMVLWTNDVLLSARRIYESAGFRLVEEEPHHSFGHDLVGQSWVLDLRADDD